VPRLLAAGHVTWDRLQGNELLGGTAAYAALAARKLGWDAAILTAAGPELGASRDLAGVAVFVEPSAATTRFTNVYEADGSRRQLLAARAGDVSLSALPDAWRDPDVLLLGPVAGELRGAFARAFDAELVGAGAQGWLRQFDEDGTVSARDWPDPKTDLAGVHVLFLSERDIPHADAWAQTRLSDVPVVALPRGWRGASVLTRGATHAVSGLPRSEVDPTGAGDVFAAAFLVRYHETGDLAAAGAFAACAASCVIEAPGTQGLGDRGEIETRLVLRQRLLDDGEWDE
jgi:sugar/nucleoside kinase (ribokinase family)